MFELDLPNKLDTPIYIAGPMTGYPEANYPAFRAAEKALRDHGYTAVLNPIDNEIKDGVPGLQPWEWYMRASVKQVADAQAIALLEGWEHSTGAFLEVTLARAFAIPYAPLADFLG